MKQRRRRSSPLLTAPTAGTRHRSAGSLAHHVSTSVVTVLAAVLMVAALLVEHVEAVVTLSCNTVNIVPDPAPATSQTYTLPSTCSSSDATSIIFQASSVSRTLLVAGSSSGQVYLDSISLQGVQSNLLISLQGVHMNCGVFTCLDLGTGTSLNAVSVIMQSLVVASITVRNSLTSTGGNILTASTGFTLSMKFDDCDMSATGSIVALSGALSAVSMAATNSQMIASANIVTATGALTGASFSLNGALLASATTVLTASSSLFTFASTVTSFSFFSGTSVVMTGQSASSHVINFDVAVGSPVISVVGSTIKGGAVTDCLFCFTTVSYATVTMYSSPLITSAGTVVSVSGTLQQSTIRISYAATSSVASNHVYAASSSISNTISIAAASSFSTFNPFVLGVPVSTTITAISLTSTGAFLAMIGTGASSLVTLDATGCGGAGPLLESYVAQTVTNMQISLTSCSVSLTSNGDIVSMAGVVSGITFTATSSTLKGSRHLHFGSAATSVTWYSLSATTISTSSNLMQFDAAASAIVVSASGSSHFTSSTNIIVANANVNVFMAYLDGSSQMFASSAIVSGAASATISGLTIYMGSNAVVSSTSGSPISAGIVTNVAIYLTASGAYFGGPFSVPCVTISGTTAGFLISGASGTTFTCNSAAVFTSSGATIGSVTATMTGGTLSGGSFVNLGADASSILLTATSSAELTFSGPVITTSGALTTSGISIASSKLAASGALLLMSSASSSSAGISLTATSLSAAGFISGSMVTCAGTISGLSVSLAGSFAVATAASNFDIATLSSASISLSGGFGLSSTGANFLKSTVLSSVGVTIASASSISASSHALWASSSATSLGVTITGSSTLATNSILFNLNVLSSMSVSVSGTSTLIASGAMALSVSGLASDVSVSIGSSTVSVPSGAWAAFDNVLSGINSFTHTAGTCNAPKGPLYYFKKGYQATSMTISLASAATISVQDHVIRSEYGNLGTTSLDTISLSNSVITMTSSTSDFSPSLVYVAFAPKIIGPVWSVVNCDVTHLMPSSPSNLVTLSFFTAITSSLSITNSIGPSFSITGTTITSTSPYLTSFQAIRFDGTSNIAGHANPNGVVLIQRMTYSLGTMRDISLVTASSATTIVYMTMTFECLDIATTTTPPVNILGSVSQTQFTLIGVYLHQTLANIAALNLPYATNSYLKVWFMNSVVHAPILVLLNPALLAVSPSMSASTIELHGGCSKWSDGYVIGAGSFLSPMGTAFSSEPCVVNNFLNCMASTSKSASLSQTPSLSDSPSFTQQQTRTGSLSSDLTKTYVRTWTNYSLSNSSDRTSSVSDSTSMTSTSSFTRDASASRSISKSMSQSASQSATNDASQSRTGSSSLTPSRTWTGTVSLSESTTPSLPNPTISNSTSLSDSPQRSESKSASLSESASMSPSRSITRDKSASTSQSAEPSPTKSISEPRTDTRSPSRTSSYSHATFSNVFTRSSTPTYSSSLSTTSSFSTVASESVSASPSPSNSASLSESTSMTMTSTKGSASRSRSPSASGLSPSSEHTETRSLTRTPSSTRTSSVTVTNTTSPSKSPSIVDSNSYSTSVSSSPTFTEAISASRSHTISYTTTTTQTLSRSASITPTKRSLTPSGSVSMSSTFSEFDSISRSKSSTVTLTIGSRTASFTRTITSELSESASGSKTQTLSAITISRQHTMTNTLTLSDSRSGLTSDMTLTATDTDSLSRGTRSRSQQVTVTMFTSSLTESSVKSLSMSAGKSASQSTSVTVTATLTESNSGSSDLSYSAGFTRNQTQTRRTFTATETRSIATWQQSQTVTPSRNTPTRSIQSLSHVATATVSNSSSPTKESSRSLSRSPSVTRTVSTTSTEDITVTKTLTVTPPKTLTATSTITTMGPGPLSALQVAVKFFGDFFANGQPCTVALWYVLAFALMLLVLEALGIGILLTIGGCFERHPDTVEGVSWWRSLVARTTYLSVFFPCHYRCALTHSLIAILHITTLMCLYYVASVRLFVSSGSPTTLKAIVALACATTPHLVTEPLRRLMFRFQFDTRKLEKAWLKYCEITGRHQSKEYYPTVKERDPLEKVLKMSKTRVDPTDADIAFHQAKAAYYMEQDRLAAVRRRGYEEDTFEFDMNPAAVIRVVSTRRPPGGGATSTSGSDASDGNEDTVVGAVKKSATNDSQFPHGPRSSSSSSDVDEQPVITFHADGPSGDKKKKRKGAGRKSTKQAATPPAMRGFGDVVESDEEWDVAPKAPAAAVERVVRKGKRVVTRKKKKKGGEDATTAASGPTAVTPTHSVSPVPSIQSVASKLFGPPMTPQQSQKQAAGVTVASAGGYDGSIGDTSTIDMEAIFGSIDAAPQDWASSKPSTATTSAGSGKKKRKPKKAAGSDVGSLVPSIIISGAAAKGSLEDEYNLDLSFSEFGIAEDIEADELRSVAASERKMLGAQMEVMKAFATPRGTPSLQHDQGPSTPMAAHLNDSVSFLDTDGSSQADATPRASGRGGKVSRLPPLPDLAAIPPPQPQTASAFRVLHGIEDPFQVSDSSDEAEDEATKKFQRASSKLQLLEDHNVQGFAGAIRGSSRGSLGSASADGDVGSRVAQRRPEVHALKDPKSAVIEGAISHSTVQHNLEDRYLKPDDEWSLPSASDSTDTEGDDEEGFEYFPAPIVTIHRYVLLAAALLFVGISFGMYFAMQGIHQPGQLCITDDVFVTFLVDFFAIELCVMVLIIIRRVWMLNEDGSRDRRVERHSWRFAISSVDCDLHPFHGELREHLIPPLRKGKRRPTKDQAYQFGVPADVQKHMKPGTLPLPLGANGKPGAPVTVGGHHLVRAA